MTRRRYATPEESFLARTEPIVGDPGCIVWTGSLAGGGYGHMRVGGRMVKTHRYAWERANGPIPDGMVLDHMCWERACCNVEHLRLATPAQNAQNRAGVRSGRVHHLPRGVTRNGNGYAARIQHNGIKHYFGTYADIEAASVAAENARNILFGAFAGN